MSEAQQNELAEPGCSVQPFRANTEMDECYVICPHCGEFYQAEAEDFSEREREETCDHCGGRYVLYDEFTVMHRTRALPNAQGDSQSPD